MILLPIHYLQFSDHRVWVLEKQNPNKNNVIMAELLFHSQYVGVSPNFGPRYL